MSFESFLGDHKLSIIAVNLCKGKKCSIRNKGYCSELCQLDSQLVIVLRNILPEKVHMRNWAFNLGSYRFCVASDGFWGPFCSVSARLLINLPTTLIDVIIKISLFLPAAYMPHT